MRRPYRFPSIVLRSARPPPSRMAFDPRRVSVFEAVGIVCRLLRSISGRSRRSAPSLFDQVERYKHRLAARLGSWRVKSGVPSSPRITASPSIRNEVALMRQARPRRWKGSGGPVVAVPGEAADARAVPAHHEPIAVMLDFVNPERAGRWPGRLRRLARFDEAGGTLQDHGRRIEQWPRGSTAPVA